MALYYANPLFSLHLTDVMGQVGPFLLIWCTMMYLIAFCGIPMFGLSRTASRLFAFVLAGMPASYFATWLLTHYNLKTLVYNFNLWAGIGSQAPDLDITRYLVAGGVILAFVALVISTIGFTVVCARWRRSPQATTAYAYEY